MSNKRSPIKRDTSIPRRPLLWMAAALLFTLPPFFDSLAIWVPWLFLLSLALKFWMEPRGYRLRSVVLKLLLVTAALTTVFISYGSVRGIESGVSLLVILMSLKILEAHTAREFRVMVLIGWMLCLCGFFLSQDFATALCLRPAHRDQDWRPRSIAPACAAVDWITGSAEGSYRKRVDAPRRWSRSRSS